VPGAWPLRERLEAGLAQMGAQIFGRRAAPAQHQFLCAGRHRRRNPGRQARPGRVCGGQRLGLLERQPRAVPHADGDGRRGGPGPCGDPRQLGAGSSEQDIDGFLKTLGENLASLRTLAAVAV
jgi:hypothetical protein